MYRCDQCAIGPRGRGFEGALSLIAKNIKSHFQHTLGHPDRGWNVVRGRSGARLADLCAVGRSMCFTCAATKSLRDLLTKLRTCWRVTWWRLTKRRSTIASAAASHVLEDRARVHRKRSLPPLVQLSLRVWVAMVRAGHDLHRRRWRTAPRFDLALARVALTCQRCQTHPTPLSAAR